MSQRRKAPTASDPAREAWTTLYTLLSARPVLDAVSTAFEISASQVSLLHTLEPGRPATMVSLARALRCQDSNVTGLVDNLERRGLVERRADPADRRVKRIALTDAGEELRARMLARLFDPPSFIARLDATDQRALRDILRRAAQRESDGDGQ